MVNSLLKSIPKGIKIARNEYLWNYYGIHTYLMGSLGVAFTFFFVMVPVAKFPIVFGEGYQTDYHCEPDYATGKVMTYARKKLRYFDFV